jgi:hypothetical protein
MRTRTWSARTAGSTCCTCCDAWMQRRVHGRLELWQGGIHRVVEALVLGAVRQQVLERDQRARSAGARRGELGCRGTRSRVAFAGGAVLTAHARAMCMAAFVDPNAACVAYELALRHTHVGVRAREDFTQPRGQAAHARADRVAVAETAVHSSSAGRARSLPTETKDPPPKHEHEQKTARHLAGLAADVPNGKRALLKHGRKVVG